MFAQVQLIAERGISDLKKMEQRGVSQFTHSWAIVKGAKSRMIGGTRDVAGSRYDVQIQQCSPYVNARGHFGDISVDVIVTVEWILKK
jgi:hypothetical protein